MYKIGEHFLLDNSNNKALPDAIVQGKNYRFTVLSERLIRLEYQSEGKFVDNLTSSIRDRNFPKANFNFVDKATSIEISTKYFKLVYEKEAPLIGPENNPSQYFYVEIKGTNERWYPNKVDSSNYQGNYREFVDREKSEALFSSGGYAVLDESNSAIFNDNGTIIEEKIPRNDIYLFVYQGDYGLMLQDFYKLTGKPPLIPKYAFGNIYMNSKRINEVETLKEIKDFREKNLPLSAYIIDNWYMKNTEKFKDKSFTIDQTLFRSPKSLSEEVHKRGVFLGLTIDPGIGFVESEMNYQEYRKFLSPDNTGFIKSEPLDPKYIDVFLKTLLRPLEGFGIDFFLNEYSGSDYEMWSLNHYMSLDPTRFKNKRQFLISKNSKIVPHKYPITWSGKFDGSFSGLKPLAYYQNTFSNTGASLIANDVAGEESVIEDPNLYYRSLQLGVFSPINLIHQGDSIYSDRRPWDFGGGYLDMCRELLDLRQRLVPFLYSEYQNYTENKSLYHQAMYFLIPDMIKYEDFRNQYFLARSFLVAPITRDFIPSTRYTKSIFYLPEGNWYNYLSGELYKGGKDYKILLRLDEYPVFVKAGEIIIKNADPFPYTYINPVNLEVEIFPGDSKEYVLYEDDGISQNYQEKDYFKTSFSVENKTNEYFIRIKPVEGKENIIPRKRNYKIRLKNSNVPKEVYGKQDNKDLEFRVLKETNDIIIAFDNIDTLKELLVTVKSDKALEIPIVNDKSLKFEDLLKDLKIPNRLKKFVPEIISVLRDGTYKKRKVKKSLKEKGITEDIVEKVNDIKDYYI